ncbi:MAG: 3'-5' exoribonuclease [Saprospiraceae bacterium]|nr:3'-5' exoribonuclease [Saprospiraceae bacterium]
MQNEVEQTTRIFLDAEFTGLHQHSTLLSLGLAASSGELFYAELTDYAPEQINPWLKDNVMPLLSGNLPPSDQVTLGPFVLCAGDKAGVSSALRQWLGQFGGKNSVEIWADVLAWDWVLFCELFGDAFSLPEQVHYIPRDLSTLLWARGIDPDTNREDMGTVEWTHPGLNLVRHHALYDALLELSIFEQLLKTESNGRIKISV